MKQVSRWIAVFAAAAALSACNTLQGAGEDIENAGEELEDATEG
jgi:predicted small secreted protein